VLRPNPEGFVYVNWKEREGRTYSTVS